MAHVHAGGYSVHALFKEDDAHPNEYYENGSNG